MLPFAGAFARNACPQGERVQMRTGGKAGIDQDPESLRRISQEASRLAESLAEITARQSLQSTMGDGRLSAEAPPEKLVRDVIRLRRRRLNYFEEGVLADPAWDMLLVALHIELVHTRINVSKLCEAALVPPTTALRWLKSMEEAQLLTRREDFGDGRRFFIELTPRSREALYRYFADLREVLEI